MKLQHAIFKVTAVVAVTLLFTTDQCRADSPGQTHLDEAMRIRLNVNDYRDLNNVVDELETALDKGLDVENTELAEQMLSGTLLERAKMLSQAIMQNKADARQAQVLRRSAESDLRRVLAYDNPPAEARMMLARFTLLPGGDRHEARRQLDAYLESDGVDAKKRAEALMLRGQLQTSFEKSLADFDLAIELAPDEPDFQLNRVRFLHAQNKPDMAIESLEQIVDLDPENGAAVMMMGHILRAQDRPEDAIAAFDRAHELLPEATVPFEQRAQIYQQMGKHSEAIDQYTALLELQPEYVPGRLARAEARLRAGDGEEAMANALADIDWVLENHPDHINAARMKAVIYAGQNELDKAIEILKELSRKAPRSPEVSLQLAVYHLFNKQPQEAIEAYSRALIADGDNFQALRGRGDAYLNIGDHESALADFERAIAIKRDDPELLNNFAWLLATSPEEEVRDGQRAIKLATKACEATNYQKPHMLSTLASGYAEAGDFETARKWSQKAVDMDDPVHGPQLAKELESYQQEKPWRERQTFDATESAATDDNDQRSDGEIEDSDADESAVDEAPIAEIEAVPQ